MMLRAYHNVARDLAGRSAGMLDGYEPLHPVVLVFELDRPTPRIPTRDGVAPVLPDLLACELVYRLLNVGDDPDFGEPDEAAVAYRARRNRSLSTGDVVAVDGRFYACGRRGWQRLDTDPYVVVQAAHGTTPLEVSA